MSCMVAAPLKPLGFVADVSNHENKTEALFRKQEVLGPVCFGLKTKIILLIQLYSNVYYIPAVALDILVTYQNEQKILFQKKI